MRDRFEGRLGRKQWWMRLILIVVISFTILILSAIVETIVTGKDPEFDPLPWTDGLSKLVGLASTLLVLAASVRRFHDLNKSGWWAALSLVPFVGVLLIMPHCGFLRGTEGSNQYGPDPLDEGEGAPAVR